jgi:hypothetical protein
MHGVALLLAVASIGADVEYGWQPGDDGKLEYIIQIPPELVKTLSEGTVDLLSEIPDELQHVKRFRIRIGTGPVPRKGLEEANAAAIRPGDNFANQPPNLNGQPNGTVGTRRPTDPRGSPTQPGNKVLAPPGRNLNDVDPAQSQPGDRFTDGSTGGSFPAVRQSPGINRNTSTSGDRFGKTGDPNDPTTPMNDRTPVEYDAAGNPRPRTPTPVWDPATQQWRTPAATNGNQGVNGANNNTQQDPRFNNTPDPRNGAYNPNANYNPNGNYPNTGYGPNNFGQNYGQAANNQPNNQWQQPGYNAPLRDPDQGYYPPAGYATRPPAQYDPNQPINRQVGYQVATNPTGAAQPNNTNAPPAAGPSTAAVGTTAKPVSNIPTRELDRYGDEARPWWPLTFTAMLLFASVGLNFYLGWIAHGIYQRYRALLMEVRNVRAATI